MDHVTRKSYKIDQKATRTGPGGLRPLSASLIRLNRGELLGDFVGLPPAPGHGSDGLWSRPALMDEIARQDGSGPAIAHATGDSNWFPLL